VVCQTVLKPVIAVETLRRWLDLAEVKAGQKHGLPADAQDEIRML